MPDNAYAYVPFPALILPMLYMERKVFTLRFVGLMTGHYLCWHGMEPKIYQIINQDWPEYKKILGERNRKNVGCPYPDQTINCQLLDYKNKKIFEGNETLNWKYPEGEWIKLEHLGMTYEEQFVYIFMDITHEVTQGETPKFIQDHIICTRIGKDLIVRK
ncbi:MAG: hypothetical protein ACTSRG_25570 [Candidatus Helarchaeota archaeon]